MSDEDEYDFDDGFLVNDYISDDSDNAMSEDEDDDEDEE